MCFDVACMSKCVSSTENALYSFPLEEYVQITHCKEIQGCRVKSPMNVLEILNREDKNSCIVPNNLVFPKQHIVTLCALVLRVCLSMYLPQECTVQFSLRRICANTTH